MTTCVASRCRECGHAKDEHGFARINSIPSNWCQGCAALMKRESDDLPEHAYDPEPCGVEVESGFTIERAGGHVHSRKYRRHVSEPRWAHAVEEASLRAAGEA